MDEIDLPFEDWEVTDQRKKLPADIQRVIGAESATVRVAQPIDITIRTKHNRDVTYYEDFATTIDNWVVIAASPADVSAQRLVFPSKWEIYCHVQGTWVLVVLGRHQHTSVFNLVSLYSVRPKAIERRRIEGMIRIERGK